ncbi:hypothetical protein Scep_005216 [Stephania cephalantha]|uniref:Uncharacterized protein n=1 Tax=Stephania cephalantha TaxID=152367 RepID=A0AAP0KVL6_9MAGN
MAGEMYLLTRWRSPRVVIWSWWEGFGRAEEALRIVTMVQFEVIVKRSIGQKVSFSKLWFGSIFLFR